MRIHEIERPLAQTAAPRRRRRRGRAGSLSSAKFLRRQRDRRRGEVDAGDLCAVSRESDQIGAGAASDFEHAAAAILVERHEPRQMMQLLEMILLEIGEEARQIPADAS